MVGGRELSHASELVESRFQKAACIHSGWQSRSLLIYGGSVRIVRKQNNKESNLRPGKNDYW